MATHPVANQAIKDQLVQRVIDTLLGRGPAPDKRMVALVCAAYAANVLENALVGLSHSQRDACFAKVDEFLLEHSNLGDRAKNMGTTEIMAGVLVVYTKVRCWSRVKRGWRENIFSNLQFFRWTAFCNIAEHIKPATLYIN